MLENRPCEELFEERKELINVEISNRHLSVSSLNHIYMWLIYVVIIESVWILLERCADVEISNRHLSVSSLNHIYIYIYKFVLQAWAVNPFGSFWRDALLAREHLNLSTNLFPLSSACESPFGRSSVIK